MKHLLYHQNKIELIKNSGDRIFTFWALVWYERTVTKFQCSTHVQHQLLEWFFNIFVLVFSLRVLILMLFSFIGLDTDVIKFLIFTLTLLLTSLCACSVAFFVSACVRTFAIANLLIALPYVFMMVCQCSHMLKDCAYGYLSSPPGFHPLGERETDIRDWTTVSIAIIESTKSHNVLQLIRMQYCFGQSAFEI